jgi:hypothetical protein
MSEFKRLHSEREIILWAVRWYCRYGISYHALEQVSLPWYIHAIECSRPLHFGDYGGIPLKIMWVSSIS